MNHLYEDRSQSIKLGNLDQLMFINDILIKNDLAIESLLKKVERQYLDITEKTLFEFSVEGKDGIQQINDFVQGFKWDDSRFPRNIPLPELLKSIINRTNLVDNDLRQKISTYLGVKAQAQALQRKEQIFFQNHSGNLLVRDLVDVLKEPQVRQQDFVQSEYLQTVIAIIPKSLVTEFLSCYESLTDNVLPASARQFKIDDRDNLTIWRVVVMKKGMDKVEELDIAAGRYINKTLTPVDEFIIRARDKLKITVKEFEYKPNESREREKQRYELKSKTDCLNNILKSACEKSFSDLYVTYIHLKTLRIVIDIAMRFGTQDSNLVCVIKPQQGSEKKVQEQLLKLFAEPAQLGIVETYQFNQACVYQALIQCQVYSIVFKSGNYVVKIFQMAQTFRKFCFVLYMSTLYKMILNLLGLYGTKEELEDAEDFFPFVYVAVNIS